MTSQLKKERTEPLLDKKNGLEFAIQAEADASVIMHHALGRGGAKSEHM